MDAQHWRRISAVFDRVIEAPASERDSLLDQCCEGDADLRREIRSLLAADAVGGVLDRRAPQLRFAVAAEWARDTEAAPVGSVIGCASLRERQKEGKDGESEDSH